MSTITENIAVHDSTIWQNSNNPFSGMQAQSTTKHNTRIIMELSCYTRKVSVNHNATP